MLERPYQDSTLALNFDVAVALQAVEKYNLGTRNSKLHKHKQGRFYAKNRLMTLSQAGLMKVAIKRKIIFIVLV